MKNPMKKSVTKENAHEIWQTVDGKWTWYVLKKWQNDDDKEYARWFCYVTSPMCGQNPDGSMGGEYGDTYVSEIKKYAIKIK